jgi:hypothetical protein
VGRDAGDFCVCGGVGGGLWGWMISRFMKFKSIIGSKRFAVYNLL